MTKIKTIKVLGDVAADPARPQLPARDWAEEMPKRISLSHGETRHVGIVDAQGSTYYSPIVATINPDEDMDPAWSVNFTAEMVRRWNTHDSLMTVVAHLAADPDVCSCGRTIKHSRDCVAIIAANLVGIEIRGEEEDGFYRVLPK